MTSAVAIIQELDPSEKDDAPPQEFPLATSSLSQSLLPRAKFAILNANHQGSHNAISPHHGACVRLERIVGFLLQQARIEGNSPDRKRKGPFYAGFHRYARRCQADRGRRDRKPRDRAHL